MKEGFKFRDLFEIPELKSRRLSLLKRAKIRGQIRYLYMESESERPFLEWLWENREAIVKIILGILVVL